MPRLSVVARIGRLLAAAIVVAVGLFLGVSHPGSGDARHCTGGYMCDYDTPRGVATAAAAGDRDSATTPLANTRGTTRVARPGATTSAEVVRLVSGFVRAAKPAAGIVDDVVRPLVGGNRRIQALRNIGQQGAGQGVREVPGGLSRAQDIYAGLSRGAQPFRTLPDGRQLLQRTDGTIIGLRPTSRSGPPSIDVRPPGGSDQYFQLHFPGG